MRALVRMRTKTHIRIFVDFLLLFHVRFEKMVRSTGKLNPTSKKTVMELLEKAREKLPPKPEKKKASPPVAAVAPVAVDVGPPQAKSAWMQEDASPVSI